MRAQLWAFWDDLRASYWFIPTLMTLGAVVLSVVVTTVDGRIGETWIDGVSWLYANKPDGARTLLSTVAGSMIGVAGVTFSITIASVVYASGQYGPRLLSNFMRDTGNQVTLGTFIATFLYCLLVLRTIRAADEGYGGANPAMDAVGPFVPHLSILVGLALTLASIGVLIYFIHHVPKSILVSNVIAGIGRELVERIDTVFPERAGTSAPDIEPPPVAHAQVPDDFYETATRVRADGDGYVQSIDADGLFDAAVEHDLVIRLRFRPGDFVTTAESLVLAWPPDRVDEDLMERIRSSFVWGASRTPLQDVRFLINELVEIGARALSPGVNDPFTAINCLDWLGAALKRMAGRDFPSEGRYDERGTLRLIAHPTSYAALVEAVFGQLRPYVAADRNAAFHAMKVIGEVAGQTDDDDAKRVLRREAETLVTQATALGAPDRDALEARLRVVQEVLGPGEFEMVAASVGWLGGSA